MLRRASLFAVLSLAGCARPHGGPSGSDAGASSDAARPLSPDGGAECAPLDGCAGSEPGSDCPDGGTECAAPPACSDGGAECAPATCGNGTVDDGELCDGSDLDGQSCAALGFDRGELRCAPSCLSFDDRDCENVCAWDVIDIVTHDASGTLTLNGAPWPSGGISGADFADGLVFVRHDTRDEFRLAIGRGGAFAHALVDGVFDVFFEGNRADWTSSITDSQRTPLVAGLAVHADVARDFDVVTHDVSGAFTLNGAPWPSGGISGADLADGLVFVRNDTHDEFRFAVPRGGAFAHALVDGVYDVFFEGNRADWTSSITDSQRTPLVAGLAVHADVVRDFDVVTHDVSGALTLNGAPWPSGGISGADLADGLVFVRRDTHDEFRFAVPRGGAFAHALVDGVYDVFFEGNRADWTSSITDSQRTPLVAGLAVHADVARDFDVVTHDVSGALTLNGAPWPSGGISGADLAGGLVFVRRDTHDEFRFAVPRGGAFAHALVDGVYDVFFEGNRADWTSSITDSQRTPLVAGLAVHADVARDFDVVTHDVSGALTLNGAPWPSGGISGADLADGLVFVRRDTHDEFRFAVPRGGAFAHALVDGVYDVFFEGNRADWTSSITDSQRTPLVTGLAVHADVARDFDVVAHDVSGALTLNGAPWPSGGITGADFADGPVFVRRDTSDPFRVAVARGGTFARALVDGSYDVLFEGNRAEWSGTTDSEVATLFSRCAHPRP